MTLLSRVCCQFCDRNGKVVYTIHRDQLLQPLLGVPEEIREDKLFEWMIKEGTLEVLTKEEELKRAENDPEKRPEKAGGTKNSSAAAEKKEKS